MRETLQARLDAITARTRELVPPDRLAVIENAIHELFSTGIEDEVLPVGAPAPAFALKDGRGKTVHSSDLLAIGPLVVTFFRGRWCPYCIAELEAWQAAFPLLRARGALLVAITPKLVRQIDFTAEQHALTFPILSDPGCALATQFGITHTIPEPLRRYYRSILINIPFLNGDQSWRLPLPATFLIRQDSTIAFAEAHADFRVRPDPTDILALLET